MRYIKTIYFIIFDVPVVYVKANVQFHTCIHTYKQICLYIYLGKYILLIYPKIDKFILNT